MDRRQRQVGLTDWRPEVNMLENTTSQNVILAIDYTWLKYARECTELYEYLKEKHLLSGSIEDQFKLKVASAILTMRSFRAPVTAETVLCLNGVIDKFISGTDPVRQQPTPLRIVKSIADIITAEINISEHMPVEEEEADSFDEYDLEADYDGDVDFDEEMLTPEFAKVVFEFCSPSRLVDLAKTIISFSEEASQVGSPLFGVIYPWHSDDPLIELADTIKLQQELVWIQEQRSNVLTALQELETDPTNVALLDNFVSQADDLLEKLTAWLSDLSGLSEDMWYHIFNQMLEFGSYEVNYYNLFLHV